LRAASQRLILKGRTIWIADARGAVRRSADE
jgi:hypothetical protein